MAVAPKSQGAGVSTETSGAALSPAWPAVVDAGDIGILHVFWEGTTSAPAPPGDWTLLNPGGTAFVIESTIARQWFYGKIAAGTEDGATVACGAPAVTTQRGARIYTFSGRLDGSITALIGGITHTSNANDPQGPSVTTPIAGSLAVALVAQNDNNALAAFAGESGGSWAEMVAEYTVALTPGFSLGCQTCIPTSDPGTVSGGSNNTTNDPCGVIGFYIKPTAAQTISPGGIGTAEGFGTAQLNLKIFPSALATAEAFGTATVNQKVSGAGNIGTAEAFGAPELTQGVGGQTVTPSAIASAEALGTAQLNLKVSPSGVATTEAFGTTKLNQQIAPSSIASEEALGAPIATFTIGTSGIASAEAFGMAALGLKLSPAGVASSETFGSPQLNLKITPSSLASSETFGTSTVSSGGLFPTGIPSEEAFGTPSLGFRIAPSGVGTQEAFGTAKLNQWINPNGIASEETFGTPTLPTGSQTIAASAIYSAEAFGTAECSIYVPPGWWVVTRTLVDGSQQDYQINYPTQNIGVLPQPVHRPRPGWRLRGDRLTIGYWDLRRRHRPLDFELVFENGLKPNLAAADRLRFIVTDYDGTPILEAPVRILNTAECRVRYKHRGDELPQEYRYRGTREAEGRCLVGYFRVDWPDETFMEWPLDSRLRVEIE